MFEIFASPDAWIALLTLTFLEIVLGIDNIIFIAIAAGKLEKSQRKKSDQHRPCTGHGYAYSFALRYYLAYRNEKTILGD